MSPGLVGLVYGVTVAAVLGHYDDFGAYRDWRSWALLAAGAFVWVNGSRGRRAARR